MSIDSFICRSGASEVSACAPKGSWPGSREEAGTRLPMMLDEVGVPAAPAATAVVAIDSLPVLGVCVGVAKKAACALRVLALGEGGTAAPLFAGAIGEKIECADAQMGLLGVIMPFAAGGWSDSCAAPLAGGGGLRTPGAAMTCGKSSVDCSFTRMLHTGKIESKLLYAYKYAFCCFSLVICILSATYT